MNLKKLKNLLETKRYDELTCPAAKQMLIYHIPKQEMLCNCLKVWERAIGRIWERAIKRRIFLNLNP